MYFFIICNCFSIRNAKIQLGETLNPLKDYAGVPSINDEGTLENLFQKVDKVGEFCKEGKGDGDLSRYFPNVLPVSRQSQIASESPRKSYASVTYSNKKKIRICFRFNGKHLQQL